MADQPAGAPVPAPQAATTAPTERLLGELKSALAGKGVELADTATREDILTAAIKAITGKAESSDDAKADDKAEAEVTATARSVLGLASDAPVSAVRVALHEAGRLRTEAETLRSTAAGATASLATQRVEDLVRKHIDAGRIREADTEDLAACRKLASENPGMFESMMARRPLPTQGRVVTGNDAFDKRSEIIASTKVKWTSEKTLQGFTTMAGLVNLKLGEAGLSTLSDDETKTL